MVYGALSGMPEGLGEVKRISADREVGNSLRSTRVSSRWCAGGACSLFLESACWGARVRDHASPFRKRVFAVLIAGAEDDALSSGCLEDRKCAIC